MFAIKQYLLGEDDFVMINDMRKVKYCIEFMRDKLSLMTKELESQNLRSTLDIKRKKCMDEMESKYKQIIEQKDEEICILLNKT